MDPNKMIFFKHKDALRYVCCPLKKSFSHHLLANTESILLMVCIKALYNIAVHGRYYMSMKGLLG
jgi:hypothetical protein